MGIAPSKSSTEVPRYPTTGGGQAPALPPTQGSRQLGVSNQALPAASATAALWPSSAEGTERSLSAITARAGVSTLPSTALLGGRATLRAREERFRQVFTDVMAAHGQRIDAASVAQTGQAEAGHVDQARRDGSVQDVYTPEQIQASRDLYGQALELALGHCRLKKKIITRWRQAQITPGTLAVRTAGFLLMDPALPVPLRETLVATLQAYTQHGEPSGSYIYGKDRTWFALQDLKVLETTIADVARQAHWQEGGYQGLQRVLLDRMMPTLLAGIQQHFPGTTLQTAVTQLPRFFDPSDLDRWQSLVINMAYSRDFNTYDCLEQMAIQYSRLPGLLNKSAAAIDGTSSQSR